MIKGFPGVDLIKMKLEFCGLIAFNHRRTLVLVLGVRTWDVSWPCNDWKSFNDVSEPLRTTLCADVGYPPANQCVVLCCVVVIAVVKGFP